MGGMWIGNGELGMKCVLVGELMVVGDQLCSPPRCMQCMLAVVSSKELCRVGICVTRLLGELVGAVLVVLPEMVTFFFQGDVSEGEGGCDDRRMMGGTALVTHDGMMEHLHSGHTSAPQGDIVSR